MKLIILGATGPSGQQVVALALAAGHDVTAVCRTPSKITTTHDKLKVGLQCYFMLIIITIMLEQTNQWVGKQPPPTYKTIIIIMIKTTTTTNKNILKK